MVEWVLRFFDLFAPLYRAAGIDRARFRVLLRTRLVLDNRRPITGVQTRYAEKANRSFVMTLAIFALCGVVAGSFLFMVDSPFTALFLVNSFVMIMVGLSLVADFTHVLMDTRENSVVLPRPVDGRTLFAVRAAHIFTYLGLLSVSLALFTLAAGAVQYHPLFLLLYPLMLAATSVLALFGVFLFFFALLRVVNLERFRDIILYFQVTMAVAFFAVYNLLPRLVGEGALRNLRLEDHGWVLLLPPAWTAAPVTFLTGRSTPVMAGLTVLAAAAPAVGLVLLFRVLVPGFLRTLLLLEIQPSGRRGAGRPHLLPFLRIPARLQGVGAKERAAFRWIWAVASRERGFKRAVYPMAALVFIGTAAFLLSRRMEGGAPSGLFSGKEYLMALYFTGFLGPLALAQLAYGDRHEAAWLYHALPLERPGLMLAAGLRVVLLRFLVPLYLLVALSVLLLWGPAVVSDLLLAFAFLLCFTAFFALHLGRAFPFSEGRSVRQSSGRTVRALLLMALVGGAGMGHYALTSTAWGVWVPVPVLLLLAAVAYRRYDRTSWWRYRRSRVFS